MVIPVLIFMFSIQLVFLLVGFIIGRHHSKFPDVSVGYHLIRAEKNETVWETANQYAGKYCVRSGVVLLILDLAVVLFYVEFRKNLSPGEWCNAVLTYIFSALAIQLVLLFVLPIRHLNKKFGK